MLIILFSGGLCDFTRASPREECTIIFCHKSKNELFSPIIDTCIIINKLRCESEILIAYLKIATLEIEKIKYRRRQAYYFVIKSNS